MIGRRAPAVAALATLTLAWLAGCAQAPSSIDPDTIAFLLPESKTARYEGVDRPGFVEVVQRRCPACRVLYANANQDAARQQQQVESVLTQGAAVLVLGAVDASAASSMVAAAQERGVVVIAYDRFIANADYYVSFDSTRVGRMQAEALVAALDAADDDGTGSDGASGGDATRRILMVNGAATDPNAVDLGEGARAVLADHGITVLAEYDTPDWSPDKAQAWVTDQLTQHGRAVDGIVAANDGTAGGAISAARAAGLDPVPPVTGQDAELAAIQRIVEGDQLMTVYKEFRQQAGTAAEVAVRVLRGESPAMTSRVDGVPALLLTPVAVSRDNVRRVIVDGGVYTVEEICVEPYARACVEAGLTSEVGG